MWNVSLLIKHCKNWLSYQVTKVTKVTQAPFTQTLQSSRPAPLPIHKSACGQALIVVSPQGSNCTQTGQPRYHIPVITY